MTTEAKIATCSRALAVTAAAPAITVAQRRPPGACATFRRRAFVMRAMRVVHHTHVALE